MALTQASEGGLKISNAGTNGQYLQKQSGNTGGLTWATPPDTNTQVGGTTGVDFNDDVKARFGTGNDLELYHNGSDSYITNATGHVELNSSWRWADNARVRCGASSDLEIYHDGSHNHIRHGVANQNLYIEGVDDESGTPFIYLNPRRNQTGLSVKANQGVYLYYDGVKKCETHTDGLHIGDGGNLDMPHDSSKIVLGASDDLQIIHDGNHSRVSAFNDGNLLLKSQNDTKIEFGDEGGATELALHAIRNGAVELYHNNFKKLYTDTNGVIITSGTPSITVYADTDGENATLSLVGKTASGGVGQAGIVRIVGDSTATANGSSSMYLQTRASNNSITTALTLDSSQDATFAGTVSDSKGNLRSIPYSGNSGAYNLVAADAGKVIGGDTSWTIPASTFSAGDAVTLLNLGGTNLGLTASALTYLWNTADGTNIKASTLTIGARSMATIYFKSGSEAFIQAAALNVS